MQYETALGLRKEHTFDEVRRYIQTDPDKIKYPKRDALFLQKSHVYAQVEASMRNYGEDARLDQTQYRASEQSAPYVPPKPKPPRDVPMEEDPTVPDRMDDQITGGGPPPPPANGGGYAQWDPTRPLRGLQPKACDQLPPRHHRPR